MIPIEDVLSWIGIYSICRGFLLTETLTEEVRRPSCRMHPMWHGHLGCDMDPQLHNRTCRLTRTQERLRNLLDIIDVLWGHCFFCCKQMCNAYFIFSCFHAHREEAQLLRQKLRKVPSRRWPLGLKWMASSSSAEGRFSAETVKINRMASKCFKFSWLLLALQLMSM